MIEIFTSLKTWWSTSKVAKALRWTATAITIGSGVKGFQLARKLQGQGQEILAQKTAQGGKIPIIYGRRRVGSTVVFLNTAQNRSKDLFVVYALCLGEVDEIELDTIEINGVSINDTKVFRQGYYAGSDKITSGAGSLNTATQVGNVNTTSSGVSGTDPTGRYRMVFNAHHGSDSQTVDPMLNASISSTWTSNHRLRGIAYIGASFEYDTRGMFRSVPELSVVVKGKKVYDPRKDGSITGGTGSHRFDDKTTFEWSENPALCLLDYLSDDVYGKGLPSTQLNLQSFQTAGNVCDVLQDTPDFNGTPATATFSTTNGSRRINVDDTTFGRIKMGGVLTLVDSGGSTITDAKEVLSADRFQPYDASSVTNQLTMISAPSTTLTNNTGTALVKVKRFSCNGLIDTNESVLQNTQDLLANMRGILNYIDGKFELLIEDTASSSLTITDSHIIDSITVNYEDKSQKYNKVVAQFFNGLKKYEQDTLTVFHDASPNFTSDDGNEVLENVIDLQFVTNKYQAYNMAEAVLKRSRSSMTISFLAVPELYKLKVGDVFTLTYSGLGFTGKLFRIEAMQLQSDGLVNIQAIEYLDVYTWEAPPQENIEPLTNIPSGFEVKAPSGLSFTDTSSSSTGRPFLSWTEPTDFPDFEYRVSIVDSSSNKLLNRIVDTEFCDLNFLKVGSNYVASVSSINSVGSESDPATLTFSVGNAPVVEADITDANVSLNKLASNSVNTSKLVDDAITTAKILNAQITETKISDDSISTAKLQASSIVASKIASGTLTSASGVFGSISANDISTGTLDAQRINLNGTTLTADSSGLKISTGGVGTTEIADDSVTDAKVSNLSANSITSDTLDSARINVETLQVKHFANASADIISHTGSGVPLSVFGSAFHRNGTDFTVQEQSTGNFCPITIDDVRNNAKYQAIFTGVLGDNTGIFVEYSVDGGTTYQQASGGIQDIDMNTGTFRTYVFVYSGTITGLSSSNEQVLWRLRFVTKHRSTYLSLYVFIDNTQ